MRDGGQPMEQPAHRRHVARHVALQPAADGVLEQRIEMDRRAQLVPRLLVGVAEALVADPRRLAARILVPVDRHAGLARVLRAAQQLGAADQRQLGLAVGDLLGEAVDQVLGHVAAGMAVEQLPRMGVQAAGDALRRVARAAVGRGEARADVAEELHHRDRIDLVAERMAADRPPACPRARAFAASAQKATRERSLDGWPCGVGDLAAADQDGSAIIDHGQPYATARRLR